MSHPASGTPKSMSPSEHDSQATRDAAAAARGVSASQVFIKIEQVIYFAVGLLLATTAAFALVSAAISVWGDAVSLGARKKP